MNTSPDTAGLAKLILQEHPAFIYGRTDATSDFHYGFIAGLPSMAGFEMDDVIIPAGSTLAECFGHGLWDAGLEAVDIETIQESIECVIRHR